MVVGVRVVESAEEDGEGIKLFPDISSLIIHLIMATPIEQLAEGRANTNIYVGNLSLEVTEEELRQAFTDFGEVLIVKIMDDKYIGSGQPRGYGYVEMASKAEGFAAITALNGKLIKQMTINVIEALPLSNKKDKGSHINNEGVWSRNRIRQRT